MKFIKKLIWLIKHQEEIENILKKRATNDKDYSVAGVPEFQKGYIDDLLSGRLDSKNRR